MKNLEGVKPVLIINFACLALMVWFTYKHYFFNNGKGIDEYILALSIYSLNSFFVVMAILQSDNHKRKVLWLILGLVYVAFSAFFLEKEILYGQNISELIITVSSIPLLLYSALLLSINRQKLFDAFVYTLFISSFITSMLPIYALAMIILSIIIRLAS